MSIHPSASFPLSASDQNDVIRIYLELLSERDRAELASQTTSNQQVAPRIDSRNDSGNSWFPRELPDAD